MPSSQTTDIRIVRRCPHCEELFIPDKYHPRQRYCSMKSCRTQRRKKYKNAYNRMWRQQNPDYFKEYWLNYRGLK